jgi:hypothetical protein
MTVFTRLVADGGYSALNLTGSTNLLAVPGTLYRVVVVVSAAAASTIIDSTGTSATAANTILTIPASTTAGTIYTLEWPLQVGLSVVCGSGVTLAVTFGEKVAG